MSLDGLRAWIGEVERKLGMRTRVFLVLARDRDRRRRRRRSTSRSKPTTAANEGGASAEEVQALREQVELEGGGDADTAALEAADRRTARRGRSPAGGQEGGSGGTGSGGNESGGGAGAGATPEKEAKKIPEC